MKKNKNYYEILKISETANYQEIKNAYKSLVKKYHPDLYVGDKEFAEQKIKEINEAYDILSNPETKAEYDEYLNASTQPIEFYSSPVNTSATEEKKPEPEPPWSLTHFLTEKFNQLDKKRQLQIFIFIFVVILALFLINLIEVKYYLASETENSEQDNGVDTSNTTENTTSSFIENNFDENEFYNQTDFEAIDNFLYDLFESYEKNYYEYQKQE